MATLRADFWVVSSYMVQNFGRRLGVAMGASTSVFIATWAAVGRATGGPYRGSVEGVQARRPRLTHVGGHRGQLGS